MLSQEFVEERKKQLLELQQQLQTELGGLSPHVELGADEEDTASELPLDEVNQDLIVRLRADLAKIDTALKKIENGTYGVDEEGREISPERLVAMPHADKAI